MDKRITDFNIRLRTIRLRELFVVIIIAFILNSIVGNIIPVFDSNDDLYTILLTIFVLIFFIWALSGTKGLKNDFNNLLQVDNKRKIIYILVINLFFASLIAYLISSADWIHGLIDPSFIPDLDFDTPLLSSSDFIYLTIASVFCAPIIEELTFRGVLFNRLKIRIGIIPAIIISSILFGIGHEFGGIISATLFGMCMCIIYLETDNILIPISIHFLNNTIAVIIETTNAEMYVINTAFIIPLTILTIIFSFLLLKYIYKKLMKIRKKDKEASGSRN